nr:ribonuclease H-like domain-containing protein [Tanacetum cinerariifolium]
MEDTQSSIRNGLSAEGYARINLDDIVMKIEENPDVPDLLARVYKCKECNKTFEKPQALGGHKASHKRPRSRDGSLTSQMFLHECKVCGEKFETGLSLGGHMRKHKRMKQEGGEEQKAKSDPSEGLFLSQKQYAIELLVRAHMTNCNLSRTPVDTDSKLGPEGVPVQDPTLYRSLAGGIQYLTFTRPNISYAVQQICLYMHDPREPHLAALKRILRYIRGTLDFGFHLYSSTTISLVGYTDADWAGCPSTRRAEAEYRGVANVIAETAWLRNLLRELHSPLSAATLVYCDNIHFVRDLVTAGQVRVLHVPSRYQYADIFTKGLPSALFEDFRSSLSVRLPPAPTAEEY